MNTKHWEKCLVCSQHSIDVSGGGWQWWRAFRCASVPRGPREAACGKHWRLPARASAPWTFTGFVIFIIPSPYLSPRSLVYSYRIKKLHVFKKVWCKLIWWLNLTWFNRRLFIVCGRNRHTLSCINIYVFDYGCWPDPACVLHNILYIICILFLKCKRSEF